MSAPLQEHPVSPGLHTASCSTTTIQGALSSQPVYSIRCFPFLNNVLQQNRAVYTYSSRNQYCFIKKKEKKLKKTRKREKLKRKAECLKSNLENYSVRQTHFWVGDVLFAKSYFRGSSYCFMTT